MNLGIICSCMMFIPPFFNKSKAAVHSMRSVLQSRTMMSLSRIESKGSQAYTVEQKSSPVSPEVGLDAWEEQMPDLQFLREGNSRVRMDV